MIKEIDWEWLLQDYINEFKHCCVPFANLTQTLEELKIRDLLLGMITNGYGHFQMENITALGIEKYFEIILVSEWEGIKKPDPLIYKRALDKLNVSPNQSIFVGDHPDNDVKASRMVGMTGVWKQDYQWDNVEADFIVNDLAELPLVIDKLNDIKVKSH